MFNKCQSISRMWFPAGKSTYKIWKGRSSSRLSWFLVMPAAVHNPGTRKHPQAAAESPAQGQSRASPRLRHPDRFNSQPRSREQPGGVSWVPSVAFSSTYPVKGIRVEGVVGVLPVRFSSGLEADLPNCENITFFLSFISNLRQENKCN